MMAVKAEENGKPLDGIPEHKTNGHVTAAGPAKRTSPSKPRMSITSLVARSVNVLHLVHRISVLSSRLQVASLVHDHHCCLPMPFKSDRHQ